MTTAKEILECARDKLTPETWIQGHLGLIDASSVLPVEVREYIEYNWELRHHLDFVHFTTEKSYYATNRTPTGEVEVFHHAEHFCAVGALYTCDWKSCDVPIREVIELLNMTAQKHNELGIVSLNDHAESVDQVKVIFDETIASLQEGTVA